MSAAKKKKRAKRKQARRTGARRSGAKPKRRAKRAAKARGSVRPARTRHSRKAAAKPRRAKHAAKTRRTASKRKRRPRRAIPVRRRRAVTLKLVAKPLRARPAAKVVPVKSAPPDSDVGSAKQRMIFELVRSRATVRAALQGLDAEVAERPMGDGKWNIRQMVLHLCLRDRARIRELESALHGVPHSWAGVSREEMDRMNAEDLEPLADVTWEEALRLLGSTRHALREALESIPEEPSEVWTPDHPFGRMLMGLPPHDVHHAGVINRWRAQQGV